MNDVPFLPWGNPLPQDTRQEQPPPSPLIRDYTPRPCLRARRLAHVCISSSTAESTTSSTRGLKPPGPPLRHPQSNLPDGRRNAAPWRAINTASYNTACLDTLPLYRRAAVAVPAALALTALLLRITTRSLVIILLHMLHWTMGLRRGFYCREKLLPDRGNEQ